MWRKEEDCKIKTEIMANQSVQKEAEDNNVYQIRGSNQRTTDVFPVCLCFTYLAIKHKACICMSSNLT